MLSLLVLGAASRPALIPLPNKVEWRSGSFALSRNVALVGDGASRASMDRLREALAKAPRTSSADRVEIVLRSRPGMESEAYSLDVEDHRVRIAASTDAGLFYGIQTLRQLNQDGILPACHIEDAPRFGWRGLLLDVSRHFYGPAYIRKFIDDMSAYKLNTFHWHLTDDGGWRMESKTFPELTTVGAWRKEQGTEWDYLNLWFPGRNSGQKLYGGFYSQKQLRDLIRYAKERNVTIVPEIEMPGHSLAAAAAHPELQCEPPPGVMAAFLKATRSQAPTMICPGKDSTIEFCKRVLDETMELFPSKFIHIGGDEVDKTLWHQCRYCQARMKSLGLKNEDELQSWFIHQMDAYVASKGRRLVGWDEILEGGLAPGATVMSWRGIQGGIAAAKAGHDVVMSPTSHCYFDYSYDTIPTSLVYSYEPVPAELTGDERRRVLGGQGNIWTEWLSSAAEVESMAYPRAAALAETLWTQPENKSWSDFEDRLNRNYPYMERLGIGFRLGTPTLEPSVLNRAVVNEWRVSPPPVPGARVVRSDGRPIEGDRIPVGNGDLSVYYQLPGGRKGDPAMARVVNLHPTQGLSRPGLKRTRIDWKGSVAPVPGSFSSGASDSVPAPTLTGVSVDKPFALLFEGGLVVERAGRYTLGLGSDDGSVLYLDGQRVLDNDGAHGYVERTVTIDLQPGVYRLQLSFFDAGGAQRLEFFWIPPGSARETVTNFRQ